MNRGFDYPVKYAVLGIEEQTGWGWGLNELEREFSTVAYIVSKVYVVSETMEYFGNGTSKKTFQVVFPYIEKGNLRRSVPDYNLYDQCINATKVDMVFDTYEEAAEVANDKNQKILSLVLPFTSQPDWIEKYQKDKEKCNEKIESYKQFEREIQQHTMDMLVSSESLTDVSNEIKTKKLELK